MRSFLLTLLALLLVFSLLYYVGDTDVALRQLAPLPSLESPPDYGPDTYITFVHC